MDENDFVIRWKKIIEEEYKKLTSEPETKTEQLKSAWRRNRSVVDENLAKTEPVTFPYLQENFRTPEDAGHKNFAKQISGKKSVNRVPILELPEVIPNQTMLTWIPIQRNLLPDKETPTNIPYFGDEIIDKDRKFIARLTEEVNLHTPEELNDTEFIQLVEAVDRRDRKETATNINAIRVVLFRPKCNDEVEYFNRTKHEANLPRLIIFQAIWVKFPEFGSIEELIQRYTELKKAADRQNFAPNIDGNKAADASAEQTLHSFKSLLCRRCFLLDCPLHRDDPVIDAPLQRLKLNEQQISTESCGTHCYLNQPDTGVLLSPRTPGRGGGKEKPASKDLEELASSINSYLNPLNKKKLNSWNAAEKSLYRVLIKTFPGNFCVVAQAMGTKRCDEVLEFSVQEGKTSRGDRKKKILKAKRFGKTQQAQLYKHTQGTGTKENKRPYFPCNHPGEDCKPDVCSCRENHNFCEKFCHCPINCGDRFPGCRCKGTCKTKMCPCFLASRECDPDLCRSCLDDRLELDPARNSCQNVHLQRGLGKELYVAPSDIAGLGCFLGTPADKNEFIAEYLGEMITHEESESRGRVYDKAKSSYMFNLNEEYIVDAARMGGHIRFANHSSKPNCQVKILLVNGDYRIGIYANRSIKVGEELFFNYGKDFVGHDLIEQ